MNGSLGLKMGGRGILQIERLWGQTRNGNIGQLLDMKWLSSNGKGSNFNPLRILNKALTFIANPPRNGFILVPPLFGDTLRMTKLILTAAIPLRFSTK